MTSSSLPAGNDFMRDAGKPAQLYCVYLYSSDVDEFSASNTRMADST